MSENNNGGGEGSSMMIIVLMMFASYCFCCLACLASGYMINEGYFSLGPLDDFLTFMYKTAPAPPDDDDDEVVDPPAAGGDGGDDDEDDKSKDSKYKNNCVYLYSDDKGKKYLRTLCVDNKKSRLTYSGSDVGDVSSIRYGKDVYTYVKGSVGSPLKISGKKNGFVDVDKKKTWSGKVKGITLEYRGGVDGKANEDYKDECTYLYSKSNGKGYLRKLCGKSSAHQKFDYSNNDAEILQVSSLRVGKKACALVNWGDNQWTKYLGFEQKQGATKVVNLPGDMRGNIKSIAYWKCNN